MGAMGGVWWFGGHKASLSFDSLRWRHHQVDVMFREMQGRFRVEGTDIYC